MDTLRNSEIVDTLPASGLNLYVHDSCARSQDICNIRARLTKANLDVDVRKAAELNIDNMLRGKAADKEVCTRSSRWQCKVRRRGLH